MACMSDYYYLLHPQEIGSHRPLAREQWSSKGAGEVCMQPLRVQNTSKEAIMANLTETKLLWSICPL